MSYFPICYSLDTWKWCIWYFINILIPFVRLSLTIWSLDQLSAIPLEGPTPAAAIPLKPVLPLSALLLITETPTGSTDDTYEVSVAAENLQDLLDIDQAVDAETAVTVSFTAPAETVMHTSAPGAETDATIQISPATPSQTDNVMGPGLLLLNSDKTSAGQKVLPLAIISVPPSQHRSTAVNISACTDASCSDA